MKKISYSKDVDALLVELSQEPIAYAEEEGQVILHYSPDDKLVLVEILDFRACFKTLWHTDSSTSELLSCDDSSPSANPSSG